MLMPAALAALAALLVPLLIHLSRRNEQQSVVFAALRWLTPRPRPRHRLRWSEPLLLVLRVLLICLLAVWLARPVQWGGQPPRLWELWSVELAPPVGDAAPGAIERRWLAPGFPSLQQPPPAGAQPVASLLRELDAALPATDRIRILVPAQLSGLDGQRLRLSRSVDWQVAAGQATRGSSGARPESVTVLDVRVDDRLSAATPYLRAAVLSWNLAAAAQSGIDLGGAADSAYRLDVQPVAAAMPARDHWLLWLVPGPLPEPVRAWIAAGGTATLDAATEFPPDPDAAVVWRDDDGRPLAQAQALGDGRLVQLRRGLHAESLPQLLDPEFPKRLRDLYAPPTAAPTTAVAASHPPLTGATPFPEPARSLQDWLVGAVLVVFAVERWFASASQRRRAG